MWVECQWCGDMSNNMLDGEIVLFKDKDEDEPRPEYWCALCFAEAMRENEWTGGPRPD